MFHINTVVFRAVLIFPGWFSQLGPDVLWALHKANIGAIGATVRAVALLLTNLI